MKQKTLLITFMLGCAINMHAEKFESAGLWFETISDQDKTLRLFDPTQSGQNDGSIQTEKVSGNVIIPATIEHNGAKWTVTEMQEYTFCFNDGITEIEIPGTIKTIPFCAISRCSNLTRAIVGEGVENIEGAFRFSSPNLNIVLPSTIRNINIDYLSVEYYNISRIQFRGATPPAMQGMIYTTAAYVPEGSLEAYKEVFGTGSENSPRADKVKVAPDGNIMDFPKFDFKENGLCYDITDRSGKLCELTYDDTPYTGDIIIPDKANGYTVTGIGRNIRFESGLISLPATLRYIRQCDSSSWSKVLAHSMDKPEGSLSFSGRGILYVPVGAKANWKGWSNPARIAETDYRGNLADVQTADIVADGLSYMITDEANATCRLSWSVPNHYQPVVNIPAEITQGGKTYRVTEVEEKALDGATGLKKLTFDQKNDNGSVSLGFYAFANMPDLEEIILPEDMEYFYSVFDNNASLCKVTLSKNLKDFSLRDCPSLETIISRSITPPNVSYEGLMVSCYSGEQQWAHFEKIHALVPGCALKIYLQTGSLSDDGHYWYGWNMLGSVEADPEQPDTRRNINGICYLTDDNGTAQVMWNENGYSGNVSIAESVDIDGKNYPVTSIGYKAFGGCDRLTAISIPATVVNVDGTAFNGCSALSDVRIEDGTTACPPMYFDKPLTRLYVGRNWEYRSAGQLESLQFGSLVTSIKGYDNLTLSSVDLPAGLKVISGFSNSKISTITFPTGIESISGFHNTPLQSIELPAGLKEVKGFSNSQIAAISFPSGIRTIGGFDNTLLTEIKFPVSTVTINGFSGCVGIRELEIPKNVTSLEGFENCTSLESVRLGKSMTGTNAFRGSGDNLKKLIVGSHIETLGEAGFYCSDYSYPAKIEDVWMLNGNPSERIAYSPVFRDSYCAKIHIPFGSLDKYTAILGSDRNFIEEDLSHMEEADIENEGFFADIDEEEGTCTLTSGDSEPEGDITIPETLTDDEGNTYIVTSIGTAAFAGNESLTGVILPSTVTCIYPQAFYGCAGIDNLELGSGLLQISDNAFDGCDGILTVKSSNPVPPVADGAFTRSFGRLFEQTVYENAVLTVPTGSKAAYQASPAWGEFRTIVEIGQNSIEDVADQGDTRPGIIVSGDQIIIDGISDGTAAGLYTMDGRLVHFAEIRNGIVSGLDTGGLSGLYIIRVGSYGFKIIL